MLDRLHAGALPSLPHTKLVQEGALRYEHCITRHAFDGAYTILHHERPPHAMPEPAAPVPVDRMPARDASLRKRCFHTERLERAGDFVTARVPVLFNDDVSLSVSAPTATHTGYFSNGDADELLFVSRGAGRLVSAFGILPVREGDYVCVPKGILYRMDHDAGARFLVLELVDLEIPRAFRNTVGQLRMDAPYGHRDFVRPTYQGSMDEGHRTWTVKRHGALHEFTLAASPLDAVGYDGTVYPWALPISRFRPRVGLVHLPPDVHTTFRARGVVVSSFVPRPLDFHPDAVPCPYPHSSVDCDEVIFYAAGAFLSRRGIERGSLTLHPSGIPHGPAPGAYEASVGRTHADETAVMLDTDAPLVRAEAAEHVEDLGYHGGYCEAPP